MARYLPWRNEVSEPSSEDRRGSMWRKDPTIKMTTESVHFERLPPRKRRPHKETNLLFNQICRRVCTRLYAVYTNVTLHTSSGERPLRRGREIPGDGKVKPHSGVANRVLSRTRMRFVCIGSFHRSQGRAGELGKNLRDRHFTASNPDVNAPGVGTPL